MFSTSPLLTTALALASASAERVSELSAYANGTWANVAYGEPPTGTLGAAIIPCAGAAALVLWLWFRAVPASPAPGTKVIPLAGEPAGATSFSLASRIAYFTSCKELYARAYELYSKAGIPVRIPAFGASRHVVLPPSMLLWGTTLPEDVLCPQQAYKELNSISYVLGDDRHMVDLWPAELVKTELMKGLFETTIPAIHDELGKAIDARFGTEENEWREVPLDAVRMVVAQAAARYLTGTELCRDEDYLRDLVHITDGMPRNAIFVGAGPTWFRSIAGFIVSFDVRRRLARLTRRVAPTFQRRLVFLKSERGSDPEEPNDFFQAMIRYAAKERPAELASLPIMATRLCIANFTSVHQTSFAAANIVLNAVASDVEFDTFATLRAELREVFGADCGTSAAGWTKPNVRKLAKADSLCRESLRLHAFPQRFAPRKVLVDGLQTPDGYPLPKGTLLTFFAGPVHRDPDVYADPLEFLPWRYHERRADEEPGKINSNANTLTSLSDDFLSWGRGRHACSGRVLVDHELKMLLGYLVLHYDMKLPERYGGKRPDNFWSAEVEFPAAGASIMVRRRSMVE